MNLITCDGVWKTFHRHTGQQLFRDYLALWLRTNRSNDFHALKGISFHVSKGEGLAVIGSNGAGKSTLLSVVTGLTIPDRGIVRVNGRIAALLELGSGFHPDLTGTENVYLNAALLGFTEKETRAMFDKIVEFSGVKEFMNEPLRTYSSGMVLRLAFAIAVNVDPDILITDEILAVGDREFQAKCYDRIRAFRRAGKTFLCVAHNKSILMELCDKAVWLDCGEMMMYGRIEDVFEAYEGRAAIDR